MSHLASSYAEGIFQISSPELATLQDPTSDSFTEEAAFNDTDEVRQIMQTMQSVTRTPGTRPHGELQDQHNTTR